MGEHICTHESLVAGGVELGKQECPICCQNNRQKAGYAGILCYGCQTMISGDEWRGDIVKRRRELLGMTRRQIGDIVGRSKHTIKDYEWKKCPERYLDKTAELMKQKNNQVGFPLLSEGKPHIDKQTHGA